MGGFLVAGHGPRELKTMSPKYKNQLIRWFNRCWDNIPAEFVLCGMAEGFDEAMAKTAIARGIDVMAVPPSPNYGEYWWGEASVTGTDRRDEYDRLLEACVDVQPVRGHHLFGGAAEDRVDKLVEIGECYLTFPYPHCSLTQRFIAGVELTAKPVDAYPQHTIGGRAADFLATA